MDKSKEYCLMCMHAKEMQKKFKELVGDYYYDIQRDKVFMISAIQINMEYKGEVIKPYYGFWMPNQSQIQDLLYSSEKLKLDICEMVKEFNKFIENNIDHKSNLIGFNQIWLGLYMYLEHDKTWSSKNFEWNDSPF